MNQGSRKAVNEITPATDADTETDEEIVVHLHHEKQHVDAIVAGNHPYSRETGDFNQGVFGHGEGMLFHAKLDLVMRSLLRCTAGLGRW